jgi:hypothetical protein
MKVNVNVYLFLIDPRLAFCEFGKPPITLDLTFFYWANHGMAAMRVVSAGFF